MLIESAGEISLISRISSQMKWTFTVKKKVYKFDKFR